MASVLAGKAADGPGVTPLFHASRQPDGDRSVIVKLVPVDNSNVGALVSLRIESEKLVSGGKVTAVRAAAQC